MGSNIQTLRHVARADKRKNLRKEFIRLFQQMEQEGYRCGFEAGYQAFMRSWKAGYEHTAAGLNAKGTTSRKRTILALVLATLRAHPEGLSLRELTTCLSATNDPRVTGQDHQRLWPKTSSMLSWLKSLGIIERENGRWFALPRGCNWQD